MQPLPQRCNELHFLFLHRIIFQFPSRTNEMHTKSFSIAQGYLFVYFPSHSRHKDDNNESQLKMWGRRRRKKQFTIFFSPFPQYLIFFSLSLFLSLDYTRTIDHTVCAFNLPTEFNASGQEHIIDDEDKVKIKVDPTKMSLDGIELHQLEVIVDGWFKYIAKIFRDACEKVSVCCWWSS